MKNFVWVVLVVLILGVAHSKQPDGGGSVLPQQQDGISAFTQMNRWHQYQTDRAKLIHRKAWQINPAQQGQVLYDFPLQYNGQAPGYYGISNFVDLNPSFPDQLLDFQCGARSYDRPSGYNHQGIDFFTWPFPWYKMDQDQVVVVAAEAGIITSKFDGNDDRSCSFNGSNWNAVYVTHADGSYAWYGHLKEGSLTTKTVGSTVTAGEFLGVVGSSGNSTGPHLHFETYDAFDNVIEPYFGACNNTTAASWWHNQKPYYESRVNQLITHASPPSLVGCPGTGPTTGELTGEVKNFVAGERVYFAAYYQDQLDSLGSAYVVRLPDGSTFQAWQHTSPEPHYAASYWYWSYVLPDNVQAGKWEFEVSFNGQETVQSFWVGDYIFTDSFE